MSAVQEPSAAPPPSSQLQTHIHGANQILPQPQPLQYVVINARRATVKPKVEYSKENLDSVKGLTTSQLVLAAAIIVLQVITTAIDDTFHIKVVKMREKLEDMDFIPLSNFVDHVGAGIWSGLLMLLAAGIGTFAYKRQRKGFIVSHLVLNILMFMFCFIVLATLSSTISGLNICKGQGMSYNRYGYPMDYVNSTHETSTFQLGSFAVSENKSYSTFVFYGEDLSVPHARFYCHHGIFKFWLAVDVTALICCLGQIFVTLTLIVYNSIAACMCCRSCCSCCQDTTSEQASDPFVSYCTQPVGAINMVPSTPMTQLPTVAPHSHVIPGVIPGTQALHGPNYTEQPSIMSTQEAFQQPAPDEKWQQLPPAYTAA